MLLYHGSNITVDEPRLVKQVRGLDFGPGFYTTTNEDQARNRAEFVYYQRKSGAPTISIYEIDETIARKTLNIIEFSKPNARWLRFIRDNRLKTYSGEKYDLIIGPTADDRVYAAIQGFDNGLLTVEMTIKELKPYKLVDQYCFATESALSLLQYKECKTGG